MPLWFEDISTCSFEEILRSQTDNRAWSKELRLRTAALINSRLAKLISWEEYTANRKLAGHDAAECKRRAAMLADEITCRSKYSTTQSR